MNKARGLYLVTESECLRPGSGAFRHIEMGQQELGRHFDLTLLPLCELPQAESTGAFNPQMRPPWYKRTSLFGLARDLRRYLANQATYPAHLEKIAALKPDFIYERASFLHFSGVRAARDLGIPHFFEANGLQYLARRSYYPSWFSPFAKWLESRAYRQSNYVFFVGSWGDLLGLSSDNWKNVENGIEQDFIAQFADHTKILAEPLRICFIGRLMAHHRIDLLIEALELVADPNRFELHLMGKGLSPVKEKLAGMVEVVDHGFLSRPELVKHLKGMHVGVIPGGFEYPSFMKIFEYGAAKLLAVVPNLYNMSQWFVEGEVTFFQKNSSQALADVFNELADDPRHIHAYGQRLHERIARDFTWNQIFAQKTAIIHQALRKEKTP